MRQPPKKLSTDVQLARTARIFKKIKDFSGKNNYKNPITIFDCLMSAVAMFGLKFPSLLEFDKSHRLLEPIKHNLRTLYCTNNVPCDAYMREILDLVDPKYVRKAFTAIFSDIQRTGLLEEFQFGDGHYLLALDGTDFFRSKELFCESCCIKNHKDQTNTYYHQLLCGSLVHPIRREVIPFAPEPISKSD